MHFTLIESRDDRDSIYLCIGFWPFMLEDWRKSAMTAQILSSFLIRYFRLDTLESDLFLSCSVDFGLTHVLLGSNTFS